MPRKKTDTPTPIIEAPDDDTIVIENADVEIARSITGLASLDLSLGGGFPLRSVLEISGYEGSGKSTLAYYLLGCPKVKGTIGIGDNEGCDPSYIAQAASRAGWRGRLRVVPYVDDKNKPMAEEKMLDTLADYLLEDSVQATLLDSVGGLMPVSEEEGSAADARVGMRARMMGPFLRKCVHRLRQTEEPKAMFLTNHLHQIIGGQGSITSGGKAVHYLSATRMRLTSDKNDEDNWWQIKGKIVKRRYTGDRPSQTFQCILVPGEGIDPGLTAVQDAIFFGLADKEGTIKLDGKSYGYFKKMVQTRGDLDQFVPFQEANRKFLDER